MEGERKLHIVSDAMKIVSKDFRCDKLQIVWTIVFMLYMSSSLSFFINSMFQEQEIFSPFADFLMLLFTPFLGFSFSRRAFKYLNEDSYTQMLFYYRSIPVPPEAVIVSRAFMGLCAFIMNGIVFFGVTYAIAWDLRASMDLISYISFGISWMGIGVLINGILIYYEFMKNGKTYFWFSIFTIPFFGFIILILYLTGLQFSLFDYFVYASSKWKLLSPVMWGSLVIGLTGFILMCYLTYKRMQLRDLS